MYGSTAYLGTGIPDPRPTNASQYIVMAVVGIYARLFVEPYGPRSSFRNRTRKLSHIIATRIAIATHITVQVSQLVIFPPIMNGAINMQAK